MKFLIVGPENQLSVTKLGKYHVRTQVALTQSDYDSENFNIIDQGTFDSGFTSKIGSISAAKDMESDSYETYHANAKYTLHVLIKYKVPVNGLIFVILPKQVQIEGNTNPKII